jgi:NADH:ubiquinone oxidoreductase subunit
LPLEPRRVWEKPHQANLTGTPQGYRPAGHDYAGGKRAAASGDYEAWTPGS